jgi:hypothetical protein
MWGHPFKRRLSREKNIPDVRKSFSSSLTYSKESSLFFDEEVAK